MRQVINDFCATPEPHAGFNPDLSGACAATRMPKTYESRVPLAACPPVLLRTQINLQNPHKQIVINGTQIRQLPPLPRGYTWGCPPVIACFILLISLASCSQYIDPNVPEPIHPLVDPELKTPYELYRPSNYDRNSAWPLIVACHSQPGDSPNNQIRDWTLLAETYGFVVVAPKLEGTKSFWPPSALKQIALQKQDQQRILATIRHVRASHNISDDRIFIHGFSGGTHAALYTGLNNPDIFRAISIIKPYFNSGFLADIKRALDPHQLVYIHYSIDDSLMGKNARRCIDWLRARGIVIKEDSSGSARRIECQRTVEFYQSIIRNMPWLQIRAFPKNRNKPLEFQFKLRSSFQPQHIQWIFSQTDADATENNNGESHTKKFTLESPVHEFPSAGLYTITIAVQDSTGQQHTRSTTLAVPSGKLTTTNPNPSNN